MKKVITYGTFDLFHVGHVRLLRRVRALGDQLVVACSTDEFNQLKGKKTVMPYEQRAEILASCRYVDEVIPEESWEQKREDIRSRDIDIFAIGDDWAGHFDDLSDIVDVVYLPRTSDISTTEIRQLVKAMQEDRLREVRNQIGQLAKLVDQL